jgi:hypothetical protein
MAVIVLGTFVAWFALPEAAVVYCGHWALYWYWPSAARWPRIAFATGVQHRPPRVVQSNPNEADAMEGWDEIE